MIHASTQGHVRRRGIRSRRVSIRVLAAVMTSLAPVVHAVAPAVEDDLLSMVSRLPGHIGQLVAVENLAKHRSTPTGLCIERFVDEIGLLERSGPAWRELSSAIGFEPGRAYDELLGERAVLMLSNNAGKTGAVVDSELGGFALISRISPSMDWRLRRVLKPSPRKLSGGLSILSLENGAFELTTAPVNGEAGADKTIMILATRTDPALFESLLPLASGRGVDLPLGTSWLWPHVEALGRAEILFIMRGEGGEGVGELGGDGQKGFFALACRIHENGLSGSFSGTPGVLMNEPLRPPPGSIWPTKTVEHMEQGAALLCAGIAADNGRNGTTRVGFGTTLLDSMFDVLKLPEHVRAEFDGVGVVAVRAADDRTGSGTSVTAVIHVRDMVKFAGITDTWLGGAVNAQLDPSTGMLGGIGQLTTTRMVSYHGSNLVGVFLGGEGVITWLYVADPGGPRTENEAHDAPQVHAAWWIININTDPDKGGEQANAIKALRDLVSSDSQQPPKDQILRVTVQPDRVRQILKARVPAAAHASTPESATFRGLSGLRWIDSISSTARLSDDGLYRGTLEVRMNATLLGESEK